MSQANPREVVEMTNKDIKKYDWTKNVKITTTDGDIFICNTEDSFDKDDSDDEYDSIMIDMIKIIKGCKNWYLGRGLTLSQDEIEDIEVLE
ncbi:MAG: hypothetical protein WC968_04135 [Bacilli bacterium]|jgi:hypothetical protein